MQLKKMKNKLCVCVCVCVCVRERERERERGNLFLCEKTMHKMKKKMSNLY